MRTSYWSGRAVIQLFLGQSVDDYLSIIAAERVVHTAACTRTELILELAKAEQCGKLNPRGGQKLRSAFEQAVDQGRVVLLRESIPGGELLHPEMRMVLWRLSPTILIHLATARDKHFVRFVVGDDNAGTFCGFWNLSAVRPKTPVIPLLPSEPLSPPGGLTARSLKATGLLRSLKSIEDDVVSAQASLRGLLEANHNAQR